MDLNQLKTFVAVAEEASLTRASEMLSLSQPAVSAQIKALEAELGVILFNRNARGMALTVAGNILKEDALRALNAAKEVFSRAQTFRESLNGECNIGTISGPAMLRLAELLSNLIKMHPNLSMNLIQLMSGSVIDHLIEGKLQGGYIIGPTDDSRIASIPVSPLTLRIVAPYAWRNQIIDANWEDIAKLPWILTQPKCSLHKITQDMFARHGLKPFSAVAIDQDSALRKLVAGEIGLALMPEHMALDAESAKEAVIWPQGTETCTLSFVYVRSEAETPIVQALLAAVDQVWK